MNGIITNVNAIENLVWFIWISILASGMYMLNGSISDCEIYPSYRKTLSQLVNPSKVRYLLSALRISPLPGTGRLHRTQHKMIRLNQLSFSQL